MVLVSDLFNFDRGFDCVATFGCRCQDLIQSLLAPGLFITHFHAFDRLCVLGGLDLSIDLVLEDLLHGPSEGSLLDESRHVGPAVGLPDLHLLLQDLACNDLVGC